MNATEGETGHFSFRRMVGWRYLAQKYQFATKTKSHVTYPDLLLEKVPAGVGPVLELSRLFRQARV